MLYVVFRMSAALRGDGKLLLLEVNTEQAYFFPTTHKQYM